MMIVMTYIRIYLWFTDVRYLTTPFESLALQFLGVCTYCVNHFTCLTTLCVCVYIWLHFYQILLSN